MQQILMQQHKQQQQQHYQQQPQSDILMRPQFMPIFEQAAVNFQNSFQQREQQQRTQMVQTAAPEALHRGHSSSNPDANSRWGRNYQENDEERMSMLMSDSEEAVSVFKRRPHESDGSDQIDITETSSSSLSSKRMLSLLSAVTIATSGGGSGFEGVGDGAEEEDDEDEEEELTSASLS